MTKETLRMQMLAGVITESEYKAKLEEATALMKNASKEAKARDTEESDREYIAYNKKRDKLSKELFNKTYKELSQTQKSRINNKLEENEDKSSLNEGMIGGIVGIGAINQIPPRAKTDYEMAFEYFLGSKYELNEGMEEVMVDSNLLRSYIDELISFADDYEYTSDMVTELEDLKNNIDEGEVNLEQALYVVQSTIDITEDGITVMDALEQAVNGDPAILDKAKELYGIEEGNKMGSTNIDPAIKNDPNFKKLVDYFTQNPDEAEEAKNELSSLEEGIYKQDGKYYKQEGVKTIEISKKEYIKDKLISAGLGAAVVGFVGALMAGPLGVNNPDEILQAVSIAAGLGAAAGGGLGEGKEVGEPSLYENDKPGTAKERSAMAKKAKAGKDIGEKGKNFEKIAKSAAKKYGSKEAGKKVAGAVMYGKLNK